MSRSIKIEQSFEEAGGGRLTLISPTARPAASVVESDVCLVVKVDTLFLNYFAVYFVSVLHIGKPHFKGGRGYFEEGWGPFLALMEGVSKFYCHMVY